MNTRRVARGFDLLSPVWDPATGVLSAGAIARSQRLGLHHARAASRALVVGGGSGRFLVELLDSGFAGEVVWLDISSGMLERTRRRLLRRHAHASGRVELRRCGPEALGADELFDLVCTHYFLDLFRPTALRRIVARLDAALAHGGVWLCSDFAPPRGGFIRSLAQRAVLRVLYGFFGVACGIEPRRLPPMAPAFAKLGYECLEQHHPAGGFLWSAAYRKCDTA